MADDLHAPRAAEPAQGYERMGYTLQLEDLDPERPWPPFNVETMWVEPIGQSRYRVKNIPFFAKPLALDDIVEAQLNDDGFLWFKRTVEIGQHSTVRIIVMSGDKDGILRDLVELGCEYETSRWVIAVDIPNSDVLRPVYALLQQKVGSGEIGLEEACLPASFLDEIGH
jgi:hypothetical protein